MALPNSLTRFSRELPFGLRVDLESYLASVSAAEEAIYNDANVSRSSVSSELFLFSAGVLHLWTYVDSQRWVIRNSLQLADDFGASSIRAGGYRLAKGSDDAESIRLLHGAFRKWLEKNELEFIIGITDLRTLLIVLEERSGNAD